MPGRKRRGMDVLQKICTSLVNASGPEPANGLEKRAKRQYAAGIAWSRNDSPSAAITSLFRENDQKAYSEFSDSLSSGTGNPRSLSGTIAPRAPKLPSHLIFLTTRGLIRFSRMQSESISGWCSSPPPPVKGICPRVGSNDAECQRRYPLVIFSTACWHFAMTTWARVIFLPLTTESTAQVQPGCKSISEALITKRMPQASYGLANSRGRSARSGNSRKNASPVASGYTKMQRRP